MTQPTPTAGPPALLNITLGVMLALMLGWFFHIASGVLVPMVLAMAVASPVSGRALDRAGLGLDDAAEEEILVESRRLVANLFRLDHLATRMRRNGDNLEFQLNGRPARLHDSMK